MQSSYLCWLSEMQISKMSRSYDFTRYIFIVDKISISDEFQASKDSVQIRPSEDRYWFLTFRFNLLPEFHSVFYVTLHVSQYLQTYRRNFYLLDLELPKLSSTWCIFPLLMKIFKNLLYCCEVKVP